MLVNEKTNVSNQSTKVIPKFGMKDKIGYLFGDLGNDFTFIFASMWLMVFYTDILGINAGVIGILFMVARIWDAFMDVLVGRFIDSQVPGKNGKFKPWIMRFAPPLLILSALMYLKIPGMSANFYLIYAFATYIIWGTLYSAVNIPYGSMASVITGDSDERTSLSSFRTIGGMVGGISVSVIAPMIIFIDNKADAKRFIFCAILFSVLGMISYLLCYKMSTERITIAQGTTEKQELSFGTTMKSLVKNKPFIANLGISLISIFNGLIVQAINVYLFKDYFHNTTMLSLSGLLSVFVILVMGPFISPLTKKFGRKEVCAGGALIATIIYFIIFLLPITNVYIFMGLNFAGMCATGFLMFNTWAFVTDVIDYQEYLTGKREDGTLYSINSFVRKIGQAIAGGLGGAALLATGYIANAPEQTAEVALNIKKVATVIPAISYLAIFLILTFAYPLTKAKVEQLAKDLEERRAAK